MPLSGQDDRRSFVSWRRSSREGQQRAEAAATNENGNGNGNDDDRKTADKAGCNFIRQRRILIRIPPLDRANESRGQTEEEGEAVFVR